ncbi:MAG: hypothetical protein ABR562_09075, partial [Thermoplasmatota archaeon]
MAAKPRVNAAKASARQPKAPSNGHGLSKPDPHAWIEAEGVRSTADIETPKVLIDEVIGQEEAVEVAKKAARQRRHLL